MGLGGSDHVMGPERWGKKGGMVLQGELDTVLVGYTITIQVKIEDGVWLIVIVGGNVKVVVRVESEILP